MTRPSIACCCFPSTAVFIDDRKEYLQSLDLILDQDISFKRYTDPEAAIKFLTQEYKPTPYIQKWVSNLNERQIDLGAQLEANDLTHRYIDIDISAIHKEIYSSSRFEEISLVVVDYAMPKINGLDFCKQLKDSPVKKLLVTGEAGYKLGVEAMNNNLIDGFISKNDENFDDLLHEQIRTLQKAYFKDLSASIVNDITIDKTSCLSDPYFQDFFRKICKSINVAEYYLVNESGCFLLLTEEGKTSWLLVKDENEIENCYKKALDNDGPSDIVEELKSREKILFHLTETDAYANSIEDWRQHLYSATKLCGDYNDYYYAYLDDVSTQEIKEKQIYSYKNYISQR